MRKLQIALVALVAMATMGIAGCWMPVQVDAPSDNTVYVLDHKVGGLVPDGRVMRCTGTVCQKIYQPK